MLLTPDSSPRCVIEVFLLGMPQPWLLGFVGESYAEDVPFAGALESCKAEEDGCLQISPTSLVWPQFVPPHPLVAKFSL